MTTPGAATTFTLARPVQCGLQTAKKERKTTMSATIAAARHVWTTDEYLRAAQAGVFAPDVRTELIEGEIIEMSAQGADHIRAMMRTNKRLREMFAGVAHIRVQTTLRLGTRRAPEPDLLVVRGDEDDAPITPPAADILLIVEVSDWTLAFDRSDKARLYARAGVGEYWIVNLRNRQVEVHRGANGGDYSDVRVFTEDEFVQPVSAPEGCAPLPVRDLLPAPDTEADAAV